MGARRWITRTAFPLPAWTPPALHSLIHCFPCFVRLCWWSAQCFGQVMWSCSSLSHNRRTDGFLPLGLSGKLPHKAQSHFHSVHQLHSWVCSLWLSRDVLKSEWQNWCFCPGTWNWACMWSTSCGSCSAVYHCITHRSHFCPRKEKKKKSWDAFSLSSIGKKPWLGEVLWFLCICDRTAAGERKAKSSGLQFLSLLSGESCYMLSNCMSSLEVLFWWCLENSLT